MAVFSSLAIGLLITSIAVSTTARTAEAFDGIYRAKGLSDENTTGRYYSVHQLGNGMIVGFLSTRIPPYYSNFVGTGAPFVPMNKWDLCSGSTDWGICC
jgi:hypothetical protein